MSRPSRPNARRALRGAVVVTTGLAVALVPAAVAMSTSASATAPAPNPASCKNGALPADVQGRSAVLVKGLPTGAWVWHDSRGFHLRVTHDAKTKLTFTGSIASSSKLSAHRMRTEKHDAIWRNNSHNAVRFTLRNHGGIDGIDFRAGCAKKVTLNLKAGGTKLTTAQIFLGADAATPAANPVVIERAALPPQTCATGTLPSSVEGRPADFKAGLAAGAWVWHDAYGFHVRVTHDSKAKQRFSGTIASSGRIKAHAVRTEWNDVVWKNNKHTTAKFTLRNYGNVDGIDFRIGCAKSVTLTLNTAGAPLATTQIHLGATNVSPTSNPFTIARS